MNRRHNYDQLEREYVAGDMGLRELARSHGITSHSLVLEQSKRREWPRKRADYRARAADRAVALMADDEGKRRAKEAQVRDNAIEAIDEAITKLREDMARTHPVLHGDKWYEEPVMTIRPQDVAILIDRLQVLFGRPSSIVEEHHLGLNLEGAPADFLSAIVSATRSVGSAGGDAEASPLPRADRTRTN